MLTFWWYFVHNVFGQLPKVYKDKYKMSTICSLENVDWHKSGPDPTGWSPPCFTRMLCCCHWFIFARPFHHTHKHLCLSCSSPVWKNWIWTRLQLQQPLQSGVCIILCSLISVLPNVSSFGLHDYCRPMTYIYRQGKHCQYWSYSTGVAIWWPLNPYL